MPGPVGKNRLSRQEVASIFHAAWDPVRDSVRLAEHWGLAQRDLSTGR